MPQQVPHAFNAAGTGPAAAQPLDSDDTFDSEASDSEGEQEGGKSREDDGEADVLLEDSDGTDASRSSLEERRAGMPAETSGQPAVTPGALLQIATPVQELYARLVQPYEALLLFATLQHVRAKVEPVFVMCLCESKLCQFLTPMGHQLVSKSSA